MAGFYDPPPVAPQPASAYPVARIEGWYRPPGQATYVETFNGQQADAAYHPGDDGDTYPAAFDPERLGVWNVAGLDHIAEPGTRAERVPLPTAGGYEPAIPEARSSRQADHIRPTLFSAPNRRLIRPFAPGWHVAPVPAAEAAAPPRGQPGMQMRAQGIFPGRSTAWPRAIQRWRTFGEGR